MHTFVLFFDIYIIIKRMVKNINTNIDIKDIQKQIEKLTIKIDKIEKNINVKNKKEKDPNMPKRNSNSYIHFYNEFIKEYINKNPNTDTKKVAKLAGGEWNKIKEDTKKRKKYDNMAAKDKQRYNNEIKEYMKTKNINN